VLFRASGGKVNPGPSPAEIERRELTARAKTRVDGCARIAVVSLKGGVGKTTTTLMLGHTLALIRGDRVVAVDANPDAGTLGFRLRRETRATVRELLAEADRLERYGEVRSFTSQASSRLEVLASHQDPEISEAFSADDYQRALAALERFYSITITDCGTGILHDAMSAVLACADQLVVVAAPALDGGRSASFLLDWLDAHSYQHLVRGAVVAINATRSRSQVRLDEVTAAFSTRCRAVVSIPWDDVLYAGAETTLDDLSSPTRDAYLRLAAEVADGFPGAGDARRSPAWSVPIKGGTRS
jgi:MinD-like ATPase involved in chromosome partitioning or flagellar assembly